MASKRGYHGSTTEPSKRDSWRTPPEVFDWAQGWWGEFDIDLAADHDNALCNEYFSIENSAFHQSWNKDPNDRLRLLGWCNPPYSDIQPWLEKAVLEAGEGFETVMLLPTPNGDYRDLLIWKFATEIVFIVGRLAFIGSDGHPAAGNTRGSCLVFFGPDRGARDELHVHHIKRSEIYEENA